MWCMSESSRSASTRTVARRGRAAASGSRGRGGAACSGACGSPTPRSATSATARSAVSSAARSGLPASHASIARPSKDSTVPSSGTEPTSSAPVTSPSTPSAMNARTAGIETSSASVTCTLVSGRPLARASSASAVVPRRAASWAAVRGRTRPRRRAIRASGSSRSMPSVAIAATAPDSASRQASRVSTASRASGPVRWRSSSKTSSMACVSAAIFSKPIVALMPFMECAIRKICSTVSRSSGTSSTRTTARLSDCRCSSVSARNIGRYSLVSITSSGRRTDGRASGRGSTGR